MRRAQSQAHVFFWRSPAAGTFLGVFNNETGLNGLIKRIAGISRWVDRIMHNARGLQQLQQ
jgi:hypothetical protein